MAMTSLYVELVVIGIETSIWILLTIVNITDIQTLTDSYSSITSVPLFTLALGLLYVIGMIFDRLADRIFQKTEDKVRQQFGFTGKTTVEIWQKSQQNDFFRYQRTRIRIVRATAVNAVPILIALTVFICKYTIDKIGLSVLGILFCLGALVVSILSHKDLLVKYYSKARILGLSNSGTRS